MKTISSNILRLALLGGTIVLHACGGSGSDSSGTAESAANTNQNPPPSARSQNLSSDMAVVFPESGPPGSAISVTGTGFEGDCQVAVFLDEIGGVLLGEASVSQGGSYGIQLILPADTAEGDHEIVVEGRTGDADSCTEPSALTASASFTATSGIPLITLNATEGRPGLTVDVDGRGFCPDPECSVVTILVDGQVGAEGIAVAEDGTFSTAAFVPAIDAAGPVAVAAIQADATGAQLRAFGELVVTIKPDESGSVIN
jgi:hypothetical protein